MTETIEALVDGGSASAGPPLGPALGPLGVNIGQIIKDINEMTKDFKGMKVPVKVMVEPESKKYEIKIGTPPASALIKAELKLDKAASDIRNQVVGDLTLEQVEKISRMKSTDLLGKDRETRMREVMGTCYSMGVTIEGKDGRVMIREVGGPELPEIVYREYVPKPKKEEKPEPEADEAAEGEDGAQEAAAEDGSSE